MTSSNEMLTSTRSDSLHCHFNSESLIVIDLFNMINILRGKARLPLDTNTYSKRLQNVGSLSKHLPVVTGQVKFYKTQSLNLHWDSQEMAVTLNFHTKHCFIIPLTV